MDRDPMTRRPRPGALLELKNACKEQSFWFDSIPGVFWDTPDARKARHYMTRRIYSVQPAGALLAMRDANRRRSWAAACKSSDL